MKGPKAEQELWDIMADELLEAIDLESDADTGTIMMDSLSKLQHS